MNNPGFSIFVDFAPGRQATNDQMPVRFQNVRERTGITSRNVAHSDDTIVSIGVEAVKKLFTALNIRPKNCEGLILASCSALHGKQDRSSEAARKIATALSIPGPAMGVNYVCSGFPAAVHEALNVSANTSKHVIVVTSEIMSRLVNWSNEATAVLFGDRAAATSVIEGGHSIIESRAWNVGDPDELLSLRSEDEAMDFDGTLCRRACISMNGRPLYKAAPDEMVELVLHGMNKCEIEAKDISAIVPHQANGRFMDKIQKILRSKCPEQWEHVWIVNQIEDMGNVGASSIPSALAAVQELLRPDSVVMCPTIGAGRAFTQGELTEGLLTFRVSRS